MSGFTKGPWQFIDATKVAGMHFKPLCVIKAGDKQVASFSWSDTGKWFPVKDESQANARLIASSPELYEALQIADEWIREAKDAGCVLPAENTLRMIRAALSKAAGEGV